MPTIRQGLRTLVRTTAVAALLVFSVASLDAQGPVAAAAQPLLRRCSYETCAIRLDRSFFGGRRVNVGLDAVSSPMGVLGNGLVIAVQGVPLAVQEAGQGRRNAIKAAISGLIGSLVVTYALQGARGDPLEWNDAQVFGGLVVGAAALVVAGQQSIYAERHFSRAVWLYNREVPR